MTQSVWCVLVALAAHRVGLYIILEGAPQCQSSVGCKTGRKLSCVCNLQLACLTWPATVSVYCQCSRLFPRAAFLFACSLSVFIFGLHLVCLSARRTSIAASSTCWTSIPHGRAQQSKNGDTTAFNVQSRIFRKKRFGFRPFF